ncbi:MAG: desulfoferrodoxin [Candidatus Electryonea clarkiae]|nr:desulfoferrodoxin [Candidatus Electryonea clarkiae]MDP8286475.1 desulfoferrodoxin [Candidatus Electryonea clarkiae]
MATKNLQIYKCGVCGNMTEVVHESMGELACCGQSMILQEENTTDAAQEKHVPVIEKINGGVNVSVGSVEHPMGEDHFIEWIEVIVDGKSYRQFLNPGDKPQAFFPVDGDNIIARGYCNLHGLWKA